MPIRPRLMPPVGQAPADADVEHVVYPGTAQVEGLDLALLRVHAQVFEHIAAAGRTRTCSAR